MERNNQWSVGEASEPGSSVAVASVISRKEVNPRCENAQPGSFQSQ